MTRDLPMIERLNLFVRRAEELSQRELVRGGMMIHYSISWDSSSQVLSFHGDEPNEEQLRSFLMDFRRFISEKEPVFINRVINDVLRFLKDDHLKGEVRKAQEEWRRVFQKMGDLYVKVDDKELTPEYVLDLWLNGHYFHDDSEKAKILEQLLRDQLPFVRMQLLVALPSLTNVIIYVSTVVAHGLKEGLFQIP